MHRRSTPTTYQGSLFRAYNSAIQHRLYCLLVSLIIAGGGDNNDDDDGTFLAKLFLFWTRLVNCYITCRHMTDSGTENENN
mmetsp:Transcript_15337/g.25995  ORF Transcript_15337/g.25995 Transcript_15337/m.25995 type:complete len:81 (+) Transcript_15337:421-663(+)